MIFTKTILSSLLIMFGYLTHGQSFEKKFRGCWGDTTWDFEFKKTGEYKRSSFGHYGFTEVTGKYIIKNDTIQIKSGFENTHGTVNEFYVIENDSIIVDTENGYGYVSQDNNMCRELKYPEVRTASQKDEYDIQQFLNFALNSEALKKFYHFTELPEREFIIAEYYNLRSYIEVEGKIAKYKPKNKIQEKFYIEVLDFSNSYSNFSATFRIHGEGVTCKVWFDTPCTKCNVHTSIVEN